MACEAAVEAELASGRSLKNTVVAVAVSDAATRKRGSSELDPCAWSHRDGSSPKVGLVLSVGGGARAVRVAATVQAVRAEPPCAAPAPEAVAQVAADDVWSHVSRVPAKVGQGGS